jgi:hypothetical protein
MLKIWANDKPDINNMLVEMSVLENGLVKEVGVELYEGALKLKKIPRSHLVHEYRLFMIKILTDHIPKEIVYIIIGYLSF